MAAKVPNDLRNFMVAKFRERVCEKLGVVPFAHQREWWLATEGLELLHGQEDPDGVEVQLPDKTLTKWATRPRPGGVARFVADLGAFKIGKSYGAALWMSGFASIPDGRVSLVGLEYDICEPEFTYLCEFLLSSQGLGLKSKSLQNNPRTGHMFLELENGCRFEAKSWERKDSLKGKEIDAYCFCEAFMLPGIECLTSNSQNLRARQGFAIFPTTPDRPWVKELHQLGHGGDPEWHCTCSVGAEVNPYTFDARAKARDVNLMTREKYAIHYEGKLGDFVGRVFPFSRGDALASPASVPELFSPEGRLSLPPKWDIALAADTGTFYTAAAVAFSPEGQAVVLKEFPNYRYVAGQPERDEGITIPEWAREIREWCGTHHIRPVLWADRNTQFKKELANYGLTLLPSPLPLEARTEITREYFQHSRIRFLPDTQVLQYELENAQWPEETSAAGKFGRLKEKDHTLDCLEHILSRRPISKRTEPTKRPMSWLKSWVATQPKVPRPGGATNPHVGGARG